jgi:hypothetical protein
MSERKGEKYQFWIFVIQGPYANNQVSRTFACKMSLFLRADEISTDVFGEIGPLNCEPVKIEFRPDAVPYSLTSPRRIPFPLPSKRGG